MYLLILQRAHSEWPLGNLALRQAGPRAGASPAGPVIRDVPGQTEVEELDVQSCKPRETEAG